METTLNGRSQEPENQDGSNKDSLPRFAGAENTPADDFMDSEPPWLPAPRPGIRFLKRLIDVLGSATAIVFLAPVFGLVYLAIRLTSRGPILFRQTRLGLHGKPFSLLKFRTMRVSLDSQEVREYLRMVISSRSSDNQAQVQLLRDPRLTAIGHILRRTSLDELPQFINVLRGDMSLVGPRAPIQYEWTLYKDWHRLRLSVQPGIVGSWQVAEKKALTFDEMVRLDIEYIKNLSVGRDILILLRTPTVVLSGE